MPGECKQRLCFPQAQRYIIASKKNCASSGNLIWNDSRNRVISEEGSGSALEITDESKITHIEHQNHCYSLDACNDNQ